MIDVTILFVVLCTLWLFALTVPTAGVLTRQSSTASFVSASDHEVEREAENEAERAVVTKGSLLAY